MAPTSFTGTAYYYNHNEDHNANSWFDNYSGTHRGRYRYNVRNMERRNGVDRTSGRSWGPYHLHRGQQWNFGSR